MSDQIISYGATVERSVNGIAYASIPKCKGVAIPVVTTDYVDATSLDSPNGFREYIKGLKDAGEISIPCGYTADGYEQQIADEALTSAIYYRCTMPLQNGQATADVFTFRGFPTPTLEPGDLGGIVDMSIAVRTTGDVTWTKGIAG